MKKIKSKILIFDFDGTIVDSKQAYYHAMNKHLNILGFNKKEISGAIGIGLSMNETLKKLGFSFISRFFLKRKIMTDVLRKANEIKKCKDVDAIKKIRVRKILVSNSLKEFIIPVLKHLELRKEFDEVYGADDFTNKAEFVRGYLRKNKINPKNCFYVGDRIADVKLAREVGCKSVIISGKCSWDSRKEILAYKPDFLLFDLCDLGRVL